MQSFIKEDPVYASAIEDIKLLKYATMIDEDFGQTAESKGEEYIDELVRIQSMIWCVRVWQVNRKRLKCACRSA